jgi:hypothetical protein
MFILDVVFAIVIVSILLGVTFCDTMPHTSRVEAFFEVFFPAFAAITTTTLFASMVYVQLGGIALILMFTFAGGVIVLLFGIND